MSSIDGVSGYLLSGTFLGESLARDPLTPVEETGRQAFVRWRPSSAVLGPASTPRALLHASTPLFAALGFEAASDIEVSPDAAVATLRYGSRSIGLIVATWSGPFDALWRIAVVEAQRRCASWSILFDGRRFRIVDPARLYARRFLEFDLDAAADQPASFAALWRTCCAEALTADASNPRSLQALVVSSDRHAAGVCRSLKDGVLAASADVLRALTTRRRRGSLDDALEQALTIVYRILFLLFAEARALVPLWHPIYRESYSIEALREAAARSTTAEGSWDALRAIGRLAHSGCRAGDLRVTPFNGRLFAPNRTPLADRRDLDEGAARRAVIALTTRAAADRAGRERIAYRDLGVEQLGAVYETLLDYEPRLEAGGVTLARGSGVRKATGTFYTPQPIADYLVRQSLEPLVRDRDADRILELRIVDPAMGSGAFLVAACRYLAQAYENALIRAGACHPSDIDERDRALIRRTIAERCLYGVDLNPMAVQLARLSLWLATLAADRPLSFLDHRLQTGDSLLGAWLSSLRRPPQSRPTSAARPLPLFADDAVAEALRDTLPIRFSLETPNDTIEHVRAKERAFQALTADNAALARWRRIAHLWCAAWLAPDSRTPANAFGSLSDAALTGKSALPAAAAHRYLDAADRAADARRLFHWELEFPEVFFEADGSRRPRAGFDAVVGNPPWDMIRADSGPDDSRPHARATIASALRFTRDSGVYRAQSAGHANRYQLFVERAVALTRPGGRLGLVLPSGLATDHGSAPLRRLLLRRCNVDAIVGMDNHRGVFPIHRSVRFLLLTATAGSPTAQIACRLGVDDPAVLESIGSEEAGPSSVPPVWVSPATLERISGEALSIPNLRSPIDLSIAERTAALFPPVGSATGWRARFGRELNASDDRAAFRADRHGLPVVDGKHIEPFRAVLGASRRSISTADACRLLRSDRHQHPRLAYRDVASATNRLTLIAAVLPGGCVSTHTLFCLRTPLPLRAQHFLSGLFNSFVVNYLVRLRVTTHVTTATVELLPIPTFDSAPAAFDEIAAIARLLARRWNAEAFARLNARVALLYQLKVEEFEHILSTFPLIDGAIRDAALRVFAAWR